jgi:hypothetical protein
MRAYESNLFLLLVHGGRRVAFKDNTIKQVAAVSPHPNTLPLGEGDKSSARFDFSPLLKLKCTLSLIILLQRKSFRECLIK